MGAWEPGCDACGATLPEDIVSTIRKFTRRRRYYTTADGRNLCAACWKNSANFQIPLGRFVKIGKS